MKLIYHPTRPNDNYVSAFDEAIVEMSKGQDINIACPYLSLNYLERIISISKKWKLITDIYDLLSLYNESGREKFVKFISENKSNIRHYSEIHNIPKIRSILMQG
jgi:hypothetical protein